MAESILNTKRGQIFSNPDWEAIVPLPSSQQIVRDRGYSHTALIASSLASALKTKVLLRDLRSSRLRAPQATLPLRERKENVKNAFCVVRKLKARRVLLVDDVMTTGASSSSAARTMLNSGVLEVDVLTLARGYNFQEKRLFGLK